MKVMRNNYGHGEFLEFYEEIKQQLFTFLNYRLNFNRVIAEDLMMDVVVKAYENFEKYNPDKGSFKNWIFTIANNHLKNHWRSLKKEMLSLDALEEKGIFSSVEADLKKAHNEMDHSKVYLVLEGLSDNEREIIIMHYINDLSYVEIAEITKKREGAIRTQLSRALKRFKKKYEILYPSDYAK